MLVLVSYSWWVVWQGLVCICMGLFTVLVFESLYYEVKIVW